MAKEYVFWYTESNTYKAFFEADSIEQAREQLTKLQNGDIFIDDLKNLYQKIKAEELDLDPDSVEEL